MKTKKFLLNLFLLSILSLTFLFSSTITSKAKTLEPNRIQPFDVIGNSPIIKKENVSYSEEWSSFKRVSANLNTYNSNGGSISSTNSVTFSTSISGNISGLSIQTGSSITSQLGYTLSVPKNKTVYLAYRVRYKVERGTRVVIDFMTTKEKSRNSYTVKVPIYGEFKLIDY